MSNKINVSIIIFINILLYSISCNTVPSIRPNNAYDILHEGYTVNKLTFSEGNKLQLILYVSSPKIYHHPATSDLGGPYSGQDVCYIEGNSFLYLLEDNQIISEIELGRLESVINGNGNVKIADVNSDGIKDEFILKRYASSNGIYVWVIGYSKRDKKLKNLLGEHSSIFCRKNINFKNGYLYAERYDNIEGKLITLKYKWNPNVEIFEFVD